MDSKIKEEDINLKCLSAIAIDHKTGEVLFNKNENKRLPIASLTKIMTAIIAIENGNLYKLVTIPEKIKSIRGSVIPLQPGSRVSLEELLYGLLLCSGNDAAYVIAEHIGKEVESFVELMNNRAASLELSNTSFTNPAGFDHKYHFSTAKDLSKLATYAMNNELFAKIVSTKEISSGLNGLFIRCYKNTNKLLFTSDNIDGIKTGWTYAAGRCLVSSVKHRNGRIISVVLNSKNRWKDSKMLLDYSMNKYKEFNNF